METTTSFNFSKQSKNEMVEIFVRLRGYTTLPEKFIKENERKKKLLSQNIELKNINNDKKIENKRSPQISNPSLRNNSKSKKTTYRETNNDNKNKLIFNYLYYMFTTYPKCNKIAISQDALNGTCIMNSLKKESDLININSTILGNASIYEYDNCFNETEDLFDLYIQTIENKLIKLFQGINSCFITCGPSRTGKSYSLFGTVKTKGIIAYTVNKILYLIDYIKNVHSGNSDNENEDNEFEDNNNNEDNNSINNISGNNNNNSIQFVLSLSIEQYYLDNKDDIFEENFIFDIKNFYSIISQLQQRRRDIAEEYKIQYMESKSNLLLHFTIYKINTTDNIENILYNKTINELKEDNEIEYFSQFTFIEMNDSLYGFAPASAPSTTLYRESAKVYNDIVNVSIKISRRLNPDNIRTNLFKDLCENLICKNCHIMILICASPCDPHINVGGNCLIWGYSLRNKINYSKMMNYGFINITNIPSPYVEDNKFKSDYLDFSNFNFEFINSGNKNNNLNVEDRPLQISGMKKNNNIKVNNDEIISENSLASKYRDLQKEIQNIKKERQLESEKYLEKFKNLEKIIKRIKNTDIEKKNKNKSEREDRIKSAKNNE